MAVAAAGYLKWAPGSTLAPGRASGNPGTPVAATPTAPAEMAASDRARLAVERGNQLLAQHQLTNALDSFRAALALTPDDPDVHYNLGLASARAGDPVAAEKHYRAALELDPDYPEVHNNLANLLSRLNRRDEAEQHLLIAIELMPDYAVARNGLGTLYAIQGRNQEAIEQFQKAANEDADYWEARFNLGQALLRTGQLDSAAEAFRAVLATNPEFKPAQDALAGIERQLSGETPSPLADPPPLR